MLKFFLCGLSWWWTLLSVKSKSPLIPECVGYYLYNLYERYTKKKKKSHTMLTGGWSIYTRSPRSVFELTVCLCQKLSSRVKWFSHKKFFLFNFYLCWGVWTSCKSSDNGLWIYVSFYRRLSVSDSYTDGESVVGTVVWSKLKGLSSTPVFGLILFVFHYGLNHVMIWFSTSILSKPLELKYWRTVVHFQVTNIPTECNFTDDE